MFDSIISLLAPHCCLACGVEGSLWCDACSQSALPVAERCYRCHKLSSDGRTCATCRRTSVIYSVRAVTRYEGVAKQLVWRLKFERARAAADTIAALMAARLDLPSGVIIAPIPTSTNRVRQRGYDQAQLIARGIARRTGHAYQSILLRLGQQQQHTASRKQRMVQLSEAFAVPSLARVRGSHIILVDDVITTGATFEAAARALKEAGAARVSAIVFAQA